MVIIVTDKEVGGILNGVGSAWEDAYACGPDIMVQYGCVPQDFSFDGAEVLIDDPEKKEWFLNTYPGEYKEITNDNYYESSIFDLPHEASTPWVFITITSFCKEDNDAELKRMIIDLSKRA